MGTFQSGLLRNKKFSHTSTCCSSYLTPKRITAIYGGEVKRCPRCARADANFVHMVWSCPFAQGYWNAVLDKIKSTLERDLPCTMRVCILGIFKRSKKHKVRNKFVDLALALAKRRLSIAWKSPTGPEIAKWETDVKCWAGAEEQALRREEARGLRRKPIATDWAAVFSEFSQMVEDSDMDMETGDSPMRNVVIR